MSCLGCCNSPLTVFLIPPAIHSVHSSHIGLLKYHPPAWDHPMAFITLGIKFKILTEALFDLILPLIYLTILFTISSTCQTLSALVPSFPIWLAPQHSSPCWMSPHQRVLLWLPHLKQHPAFLSISLPYLIFLHFTDPYLTQYYYLFIIFLSLPPW